MKTLKFKITALLFTAILFSVQTNAFAQRGYGNGNGNGNGLGQGQGYYQSSMTGQGNGVFCNNIPNLTDEQRSKIEVLRVAQMKARQTNQNLMREKRAHLITLQTADVEDVKVINGTIDDITELQNKQWKNRSSHMLEVRKLLTAEQKVYFNSNNGRKGQGYGRGNGRRNGNGNRNYGNGNYRWN